MNRLFWASTITLTILSSFVFFVVILILLYTDAVNIWLAISWTIIINFISWLIGPWITDHINKWFYKTKFLSKEEVERIYPEVAKLINEVSTKHHFPFPKIGIIPDKNPTAFSYGSGRYNSRIVLTDGIFHFLDIQEVKAVVAHELGHIVHRDFIVIMIASTLLQILYEIYAVLIRARGRKSGGPRVIALVTYVLYLIGTYMLYYLSRTRETLADEFSARITSPTDLANGLIKIAYGIVTVKDSDSTKRLLESTRHLGIIDVKNAKHIGVTTYIAHENPDILSEVMVFDKISPWAKLIELNSTHPLTGNRIDHLSDLSKELTGQEFPFDVGAAIARLNIDKSRLYSNFFFGVIMYFAPVITSFIFLFLTPLAWVPAGFALGLLIQTIYKFPFGKAVETTILDEMRNPYASPIKGKPILLTGQVIGRGVPGYMFGEDMMYQDKTGLTFLDYNSLFSFVGNFFFALGKIKTLFNVPSKAEGWFFRQMSSIVSLRYIQTDKETIESHPILWSFVLSVILFGVSYYLFFHTATNSNSIWNFSLTEFLKTRFQ